jgi:beta-phosphoglucomutase
MTELKAVLFDLDGTLIDSERFHYNCWLEILNAYSIQMSWLEWIRSYAGHTLPINCLRIKEAYQLDIPLQELIDWRESLSIRGFSTIDIDLMPYAWETLTFFKDRGLKIALVTASPRNNVDLIFARNGMAHFFDELITRSDVIESKPSPESYILAYEKLGVDKDACIAFEDTINGVRAAKAANLICYAIQSDPLQQEQLSPADEIFPDLEQARVKIVARYF